ncbi:MAG: type II and III secretion system protein family protein [Bosea sp. (in: a-proteobacteria)]
MVLAIGAPGSAIAQVEAETSPAPVFNVKARDNSVTRKIDLSIGKSLIVELPRDAKEVFVANPAVANAVVRSTRKLYVIGVKDGTTSVFAMDAEGRQIATLEIVVGRDLTTLQQTLRVAMPRAQIDVQSAGDSILMTGIVNNASEATQAVDIAKAFVGVSSGLLSSSSGAVINSLTIRGRDQVMLKVTVAEVSRVALKQLGVNSTGEWRIGNFRSMPSIDNPLSVALQPLSQTAITAGIGNANNFTLRTLERAGLARTIAEPNLTAISGESAKFTAGGEIPVPQGQTCVTSAAGVSCDVRLEYKPFGVSLNFTPIVMSEGRISLRVATEVTEVDTDNQFQLQRSGGSTNAVTNVPSFKVRKADTTVELPSGATLVTAGLITQSTKTAINGLPGLMNIPILGTLFRSRDYQRQETELMIMATPYIVKPVDAAQVKRPDDGFIESNDAQANLLGRLNKIYGTGTPMPPRYNGRVGFIAD